MNQHMAHSWKATCEVVAKLLTGAAVSSEGSTVCAGGEWEWLWRAHFQDYWHGSSAPYQVSLSGGLPHIMILASPGWVIQEKVWEGELTNVISFQGGSHPGTE